MIATTTSRSAGPRPTRLRPRGWPLALLLITPAAPTGVLYAQDSDAAPTIHRAEPPAEPPDCNRCHYCDTPTAADRCLRDPCTRGMHARTSDDYGPSIVILDELARDYLPVPFDHEGHARMSGMGTGCATCHHHTLPGERPPACITCHDPSVEGTDPHKPGLKGAYHQQCLNCHREWIDETACEICHLPRSGVRTRTVASGMPMTDDILKRMHPPIPPPEGELYRASGAGKDQIVFRHDQHVERFGLACVECHHEPSCARCHTGANGAKRERTLVEHHRPCMNCHKDDMDLAGRSAGHCDQCHWREGAPKPAPFDHAMVGWPLSRFHERVKCRECHVDLPFKRLDTRCESCHGEWNPETFDHRITGQSLDENHASIDCETCHRNRRYDQPPACGDCHDDEDNPIAFPARRPGELITPSQ